MAKEKLKQNQALVNPEELGLDPLDALSKSLGAPIQPLNRQALSESTVKGTSSVDISNLDKAPSLSGDNFQDSELVHEQLGQEEDAVNQWVKGIGKFVGKTLTATLGGTVGSAYGLVDMLATGELNKFYDNDFSKAMDKANEWMDEKLQFHQTKEAEDTAWYKQMYGGGGGGFVKFWADDVLGGLSFTAGAVLSETLTAGYATPLIASGLGKIGSVAQKALNLENTINNTTKASTLIKKITAVENIKDAAGFTRQLITGAGYEAGVEANNVKKEIIKDLKSKKELELGVPIDEKSEEYAKIVSEANNAANTVFAANMALLSVGNAIMLPKTFNKTADLLNATKNKLGLNPIKTVEKLGENELENAAKALGKSVDDIKNMDFINAWDTYSKTKKAVLTAGNIIKTPISEGLVEEGGQGVISDSAKRYVAAKYDPKGHEEGYNLYSALWDGIKQTYGTEEGLKEVGIGMIIGGMGFPHFGKKEDGSNDIQMQGGMFGAVNEIKENNESTNHLVNLMNTNKANVSTKALLQMVARESTNKPNIGQETIFERKNKENDQFFNYVHSRIKGGYFSSITDDLTKNISNLDTNEFKQLMGFNNKSEEEVKQEKQKLVSSIKEKANSIRDAVKIAERLNPSQDEDVTEGLAYTIANLKNIDAREKNIYTEISNVVGGISSQNLIDSLKVNFNILKQNKKVEKALSTVENVREEGYKKDIDNPKEQYAKLKEELIALEQSKASEKEKKEAKKLLKMYNSDFDNFVNLINNNNVINKQFTKLKDGNPDKFDEVQEMVSDLNKLYNKRQAFLETYQNLKTEEGQKEFTNDINNFKSYLFSRIPENLAKQSATLAYYKQLGDNIVKNTSAAITPVAPVTNLQRQQATQARQSAQPAQAAVQQTQAAVQSALQVAQPVTQNTPATTQQTVQPTSQPQIVQQPVSQAAVSQQTSSQITQTTEDDELDLLAADVASLLQGRKELNVEEDEFSKFEELTSKVKPIVIKMAEILRKKNPQIARKDLSETILKKVAEIGKLNEVEYNMLTSILNASFGGGITANQISTTYLDFKKQTAEKTFKTDLADQPPVTPKELDEVFSNIKSAVDYEHLKNTSPESSLAILTHEYTEKNGKITTTKLNTINNNHFFLSNEKFSGLSDVKLSVDYENDLFHQYSNDENKLAQLDFPIKIVIDENTTTFLHTPKWILEIKDKNGIDILTNEQINMFVDLALQNKNAEIVKYFKENYNSTEVFRNSAGESFEDIVKSFAENVKLRKQLLTNFEQDKNIQYDVTIESINPGKISWNLVKGETTYDEAAKLLPSNDIKFAVVGNDGSLYVSADTLAKDEVMNKKEALSAIAGTPVLLVPMRNQADGTERSVAVPIISKKTSEEQHSLFFQTIRDFLMSKKTDDGKTVKIKNTTLRLNKVSDLKKFLSIYCTFIPNMSSIKLLDENGNKINRGKIFVDFADDSSTEDNKKAIQVMIPGVIFKKDEVTGNNVDAILYIRSIQDAQMALKDLAKKQGLQINNVNSSEYNGLLKTVGLAQAFQVLEEYIKSKRQTVEITVGNEQLLEDSNVKTEIPKVVVGEEDFEIFNEQKVNYTEHVKGRIITNVNGKNKVEDEYVYIEQPVFQINYNSVFKHKVEKIEENKKFEDNNFVKWNLYGNEETTNWKKGNFVKTKGGKDAVELFREKVEDIATGQSFSKEYAIKNSIKYQNEHVELHIVPLEELNKINNTESFSQQAIEDIERAKIAVEKLDTKDTPLETEETNIILDETRPVENIKTKFVEFGSTPQPNGDFSKNSVSSKESFGALFKINVINENKAFVEFISNDSTNVDAFNYPDLYIFPVFKSLNARTKDKITNVTPAIYEKKDGQWKLVKKGEITWGKPDIKTTTNVSNESKTTPVENTETQQTTIKNPMMDRFKNKFKKELSISYTNNNQIQLKDGDC